MRISRLIFSLAVVLIAANVVFAQCEGSFAGGTGTATDPYQISTPEQLQAMNFCVGETYTGTHFQLQNDIDLSEYLSEGGAGYNDGAGWKPVGNNANPFYGNFDGNGKRIIGLWINASDNYAGLFGGFAGAEIKNLGILLDEKGIKSNLHTGGLAGYNSNDNMTISNSYVKGNINGAYNVGGLVGSSSNTIISNSYVEGDITGNLAGSVGGLVGNSGYITIVNSYVVGNVNGTGNIVAGGLVGSGSIGGSISNSYIQGNVSCVGGAPVGGLVGNNGSDIINSYAIGIVTGGNNLVGGLVGQNSGAISNSYFKGDVSSIGSAPVGGLVGQNSGVISNSYAVGNVSFGSLSSEFIGGLVGTNNGMIENSFYNLDLILTTNLNEIGEGKTTAEMQDSYFVTLLNIYAGNKNLEDENADYKGWIYLLNDYPILSAEKAKIPITAILAADIEIPPQTYIGAKIEPEIIIDGLTLNTDFTVSYSDNINIGQATVIITGKGNYTGTKTIEFTIVAPECGTTLFAAGTGTATDPYQITTPQQLQNMNFCVGETYTDTHFQLQNDIDLSEYLKEGGAGYNDGKGWKPTGSSNTFYGNFDGNGKKITGLWMNWPNTMSGNSVGGLLGIFSGEIKNLGVELDGKGIVGSYAGGLVGRGDNIIISNSYVIGNISGTSTPTGGLVGNATNVTIKNSYATGEINAGSCAGGLTGYISGTIINSYFKGSVNGGSPAGGLDGCGSSITIIDSYAEGDINGSSCAGGLTGGNNGGDISNSYFKGNVNSTMGPAGGLNGCNSDNITIQNSFAEGEVTNSTIAPVGGLTGTGGTISNSYFKGIVSSTVANAFIGDLAGDSEGSIITTSYSVIENTGTIYLNNTPETKTLVEMKSQSTYADFDFAKIWIFDGSINDGYPSLAWVNPNHFMHAIIEPIPEVTYNGEPQTPAISVSMDGTLLQPGTDYTLEYSDNTNAGQATVTAKGKGNYSGEVSANFTISPKSIEEMEVEIRDTVYVGGVEIKMPVKISGLVMGKDFEVEYGNNTAPGVATATITGIGNYTGTIVKNFNIDKKQLKPEMLMAIPDIPEDEEPTIIVADLLTILKVDEDYTLGMPELIEDNEYKIKITGAGNYTGEIIGKYKVVTEIIQEQITEIAWLDTSFVYNGKPRAPRAIATFNGAPIAIDVTVVGGDAINANEDKYTAEASIIDAEKIYVIEGETYKFSLAENANKTHQFLITKAPINLKLKISDIEEDSPLVKEIIGNQTVIEEIVRGVTYHYSKDRKNFGEEEPAEPGMYYAYAAFTVNNNNYAAGTTDTTSFLIAQAPTEIDIRWSNLEFTYNGVEQKPKACAVMGESCIDLPVTGATNVGTHTATANIDAAQFASTKFIIKEAQRNKEFTINPKSLPANAIQPISNVYFTGVKIEPSITVKDGSKELTQGTDYEIEEYGANLIGLGSVTIKGKEGSNYTGKAKMEFLISSIGAVVVNVEWGEVLEFEYNGEEQAPTATAKIGNILQEINIVGAQTEAGSHFAVAQLKEPSPYFVLGNSMIPYKIKPAVLEVEWSEKRNFTYNKMVQSPTPSVNANEVELRIINAHSEEGEYTAENKLAPFAQIISANANNYVLEGNSVNYEIKPAELNPYFDAYADYGSTLEELEVPHIVFNDKEYLREILVGLLSYSGFQTNTITNETDDESSVLEGTPEITIEYEEVSFEGLFKRVETTQTAKATIKTNGVTVKNENYTAKERIITLKAIMDASDDSEDVPCSLNDRCAPLNKEACLAIGGTEVGTCGTVECFIDGECQTDVDYNQCYILGGIPNGCDIESPIRNAPLLSGGNFHVWQTASGSVNVDLGYHPLGSVAVEVYDIKGKLVASQSVNTRYGTISVNSPNGMYMFKSGKKGIIVNVK